MRFRESLEIGAGRDWLFALSQDYSRRVEWDPFLRRAEVIGGGTLGVEVRTWCVSRWGIGMETEYVSYDPPYRIAVTMTRGPWFFSRFAGTWLFEPVDENRTRVEFIYSFEPWPVWLGGLLVIPLKIILAIEMRKRLQALKKVALLQGL